MRVMTREAWNELTDRQRQIRVAEGSGWSVPKYKMCGAHYAKNPKGDLVPAERVPDYLNDLNAMHEAEEGVVNTRTYRINLALVTGSSELNREWYLTHATPAQRAEAFCLTTEPE